MSMGGAAVRARFVPAAAAADVPPGSAVTVEVAGRRVALVNHRGSFSAVDDGCTHAAGPLGEGRLGRDRAGTDCLLECPWHGAVFDVRTGEVRRGPARKPLRTYQVKVADGTVLIAVG